MAEISEPKGAGRGRFKLEVPVDASGVEGLTPGQPLKVVAQDQKGVFHPLTIKLDAKGQGVASFAFAEQPGALRMALGPEDATEEEVMGMQTIGREVPARLWVKPEVTLPAVRIHPFFWHWWKRWCRTFVVRGRVLCANGNPVPGAKVCAYDVDWWWWWISRQQVGCDVTDANGAFEIKFRWCCGWWPWWWWRRRFWHIEPMLAGRILAALRRDPRLPELPPPGPRPSLDIFEQLLAAELPAGRPVAPEVEPAALDALRRRLLKTLPQAVELERLHVWPWWPWQPWWDCTPDIIFRVTQDCREPDVVVVDEGLSEVRWNIPTELDVTLTANEKACCVDPPLPEPPGNCVDYTTVCGVAPENQINHIGGNLGAAPTPAGFLNPGTPSIYGDRPYAGVVDLYGVFGTTADVDYYEFQYSTDDGATWHDLPASAYGSLVRGYLGNPGVFGEPGLFHSHQFLTTVAGRTVLESRRHFEANPGWSAVLHHWLSNTDLLMRWSTSALSFADGAHRLRLKGWKWDGVTLTPAPGGVAPDQPGILPLCISRQPNTPNYIVLALDNRLVDGGSGHPPSVPSHPCGPGTVHYCTLEPDTDILAVTIIHPDLTETNVTACGNVPVKPGDILQIDFLVTDASKHLAFYTLIATYGENLMIPLIHTGIAGGDLLLNVPGASLTAAPGVQVGPCYDHPLVARSAVKQGATLPEWGGGTFRLRVPIVPKPVDPSKPMVPFPETCCYQLELRAYKRTVVSCYHGLDGHRNLSEYTFMVVV